MQSTSQRRRWNNRLIFGVLVFMVLLNLPTLIKTYLLEAPVESEYPYLLDPNQTLQAIYSSQWSLTHEDDDWVLSVPSPVKAQELAARWQSLTGTQVPDENYQSLKSRLSSPSSIEVWYADQEEPQRITFYQLPQFWLLKNWQGDWIAVTVDKNYLFPTDSH
ncbi:hypothetical protein [Vibrio fluminensis]|uniref:hypothetical protein n=1 Tax=Vibrio fluminensis TaxID=2783614 RepID=UPI001888A7D8|nr:hypothetical protein [Vibrio fluminensis]